MSTQVGLRDYLGRGHHDDGREGIVLTKLAAGDLVKVPFGTGTNNTRGLSAIVGTAAASSQSQIAYNPDGSGTALLLSANNGVGNGTAWTEVLYGSIVGFRYYRDNSTAMPPVNVVIDGVAHEIPQPRYRHNSVLTSAADPEALWIVADDLDPDVPHTVTVVVAADPYGGVNRSVTAFGWLLEASRGYKPPPRRGTIGTGALLSTSTTALNASTVYRKILLNNTDSSARLVTLKNGSTVLKKVYLAASGTDGDSKEIDLGVPIVGISTLTLQADANSVVVWIPFFEEGR